MIGIILSLVWMKMIVGIVYNIVFTLILCIILLIIFGREETLGGIFDFLCYFVLSIGVILKWLGKIITFPIRTYVGGLKKKRETRKHRWQIFNDVLVLSEEAGAFFGDIHHSEHPSTNTNMGKMYDENLDIWGKALSKLEKVAKGAIETGDRKLIGRVEERGVNIKQNMVSVFKGKGDYLFRIGQKRFINQQYEQSLTSYNEARSCFEEALKIAEETHIETRPFEELIQTTNHNIKQCHIGRDKDTVEKLTIQSNQFLKEGITYLSQKELFRARMSVRYAHGTVDKALSIAQNRNFTKSMEKLNSLTAHIVNMVKQVDTVIGGTEDINAYPRY